MSADQSSLTEHDMLGMRMASENRAKISFPNICYLGDLGQVSYLPSLQLSYLLTRFTIIMPTS